MAFITGTVLILINVVVMIIGVILLLVGAFFQWGYDFIENIVIPSLAAASAGAEAAGSMSSSYTISLTKDILRNYHGLISAAGWIVFLIGCVLACTAILAYVAVCCKVKILLQVYIALVSVVLLVMIILLITYAAKRPEMYKQLSEFLLKGIQKEFTGMSHLTGLSAFINVAQARLSCCGVHNGSDFNNATKWWRNVTFTINGEKKHFQKKIPTTCCKLKTNQLKPIDKFCTIRPTTNNSYENIGCLDELWTGVTKYGYYSSGVAILICLFLVAIIIMTVREMKAA